MNKVSKLKLRWCSFMENLKFEDSLAPRLTASLEPFAEWGEAELIISRENSFSNPGKFIIDCFNVDDFLSLLKVVKDGNGGMAGGTVVDYNGDKLEVTSSFDRNGTIVVLWIVGTENILWLEEAEAGRLTQALEALKNEVFIYEQLGSVKIGFNWS